MDGDFIRRRITELRIKRNISEYQMSLDLGKSQGYMQSISSGRTLPAMQSFLEICDYFGITPQEFFDTDHENPKLLRQVIEAEKELPEEDLLLLEKLIRRLREIPSHGKTTEY